MITGEAEFLKKWRSEFGLKQRTQSEPCPDCGLGLDCLAPHVCDVPRLLAVLDGLEITPEELRSIKWLAGTEKTTINNMIRLFEKCRDAIDRVPM